MKLAEFKEKYPDEAARQIAHTLPHGQSWEVIPFYLEKIEDAVEKEDFQTAADLQTRFENELEAAARNLEHSKKTSYKPCGFKLEEVGYYMQHENDIGLTRKQYVNKYYI